MDNLALKPDRLPNYIERPRIRRRFARNRNFPIGRKAVAVPAERYDALDYLLMTTFPASDATAKY